MYEIAKPIVEIVFTSIGIAACLMITVILYYFMRDVIREHKEEYDDDYVPDW